MNKTNKNPCPYGNLHSNEKKKQLANKEITYIYQVVKSATEKNKAEKGNEGCVCVFVSWGGHSCNFFFLRSQKTFLYVKLMSWTPLGDPSFLDSI